jgi:hypothetical protein
MLHAPTRLVWLLDPCRLKRYIHFHLCELDHHLRSNRRVTSLPISHAEACRVPYAIIDPMEIPPHTGEIITRRVRIRIATVIGKSLVLSGWHYRCISIKTHLLT